MLEAVNFQHELKLLPSGIQRDPAGSNPDLSGKQQICFQIKKQTWAKVLQAGQLPQESTPVSR